MHLKKNTLGNTGIEVTELCFGVLPMGPLQLGVDVKYGAQVIREAVEAGVDFLDTAQGYRTYEHIRLALDGFKGQVHIASKSQAASYETMEAAVRQALQELRLDSVDVFLLHAARSGPEVFDERAGALACLRDQRSKGLVRSVGISTHSVTAMRRAVDTPDIDVLFPIINRAGLGILHGARDEMAEEIARAARLGKGVYAMKSLGGGNLISDVEGSLAYVRGLPGVSSVAVGMVALPELRMNLDIFEGRPVRERVPGHVKNLFIQSLCEGCGTCVKACPNGALSLVNGKATVDKARCIMCGYCAPECPEFAIRLV